MAVTEKQDRVRTFKIWQGNQNNKLEEMEKRLFGTMTHSKVTYAIT